MSRSAALAAVFALSGLQAAPASAQLVSLRLGALSARYADSVSGSAGSLGARVAWSGQRSRGAIEGSWAQFTTGGAAGQAWTDIAVLAASSPRAAAGFRVTGIANGTRGGPISGTANAEAFGLYVVHAWTFGLSAAGGYARSIASVTTPTGYLAARARLELSPRLALTAAAAGTVAGSTRFADATLTADWRHARVSGGLLVGARTGDLAYHPWTQAWGSYAITPCLALEAALGSYPRDLTGFDHGRYVNVGMRVNLGGRSEDNGDTAAALVQARTDAALTNGDLVIEPVDSATTRVAFRVAGVSSLAIAGEWNDWSPTALSQDARGRWTGVIPVGRGAYRFALVDQTGQFLIPAGVTKLSDDFGGDVGLLIVR